MTDVNDFTDYTESCDCGHARGKHGASSCTGTRSHLDTDALPEPEYAPEDAESPFPWPSNWPPVGEVSRVETPCECMGFGPAEPSEPEDWS